MVHAFALLLTLLLGLCATPAPARTTSSLSLRSLGFENVETTSRLNFEVEYLPGETAWVQDIIGRASAARSLINEVTGDPFLTRIRVIITPDRTAFLRLVGPWAENSAAVAVPRENIMIINGDVMRAGPPATLGTTLLHEMAHLYLGVSTPRPLPRWLDEGLAQIMAHEGTAEGIATLTWAKWLRGIIPLRDLERSFPVEGNRQRLAYQESLSIAQHIIEHEYGGSLPAFLNSITGANAENEIARFWNPLTRDVLETRWRQSLTARGNWVTLVLSSGLFWGFAAVLSLVAYLVIRHRRRALRREWDEEERIYEVLDEEERRIYGDDDDLVYRDEDEFKSAEDWEDGRDRR